MFMLLLYILNWINISLLVLECVSKDFEIYAMHCEFS